MHKILAVMGTRPEAIKLAPVIRLLRRTSEFRIRLCATAQHRDLLDSMLQGFGLRPNVDLDVMRPGQSASEVLRRVVLGFDGVLRGDRPDLVLVQGDTTSALGAALAAYYRRIPVAHVEAGLRTGDLGNPFPEEANRALIDRISDLLFAPTPSARRNLLREGLCPKRIFVTGNTGVDSLLWAANRPHRFACPALLGLGAQPLAVLTLHRRESFGAPMERVFRAILEAAERFAAVRWVYPVHPNPNVRLPAKRILRHPRILLTPPLGYLDFVQLMQRALFIVTDSGGIQEEAPSLGKPVIVVRERTERTEILGRGGVLVGTSRLALLGAISRQFSGSRGAGLAGARNPFGDGKAAWRIVREIRRWAARRKTGECGTLKK